MATRSRSRKGSNAEADVPTEASAPENSSVDYASLVAVSSGFQAGTQGRTAAPNPLAGMVMRTVTEQAPLMLPVQTAEQAKEVTNLLRRDARETEYGLRIQYQDGNGNVVRDQDQAKEIHFVAKERSSRKYTTADIREWARETGTELPAGKIPNEIRHAFRIANGYEKSDEAVEENTETVTADENNHVPVAE